MGVAALGVFGAAAYATGLLSQDSLINGCVNNATGVLRVVSNGASCSSGERAISWARGGAAPQDAPTLSKPGQVAYAHFTGGALDASRSSGITSWSRYWANDGATYCINVRFTPRNVTTSAGFFANPSLTSVVQLKYSYQPWFALKGEPGMSATPCPVGTSAAAQVFEYQATNFADFYVSLSQ